MNTIPAQEIKRRGITAVDALIEQGAVHAITQNVPTYRGWGGCICPFPRCAHRV